MPLLALAALAAVPQRVDGQQCVYSEQHEFIFRCANQAIVSIPDSIAACPSRTAAGAWQFRAPDLVTW